MRRAEAGPVEIPQAPCPAQMNRPGMSGTRTDERPAVEALPAGAGTAAADGRVGDRGDEPARPGEDPLDPCGRVRTPREERRPDRGDPVERHQAEIDEVRLAAGRELGPRPDRRADLGLLQDVGRSGRQLGLDDDAPPLPDRPPPPVGSTSGAVTRARRRRARHRQARPRHRRPPRRPHPRAGRSMRVATHPDADSAALGDRRVGVGRGCRRDGVADPDAAAPQVGGDRRLDGLELGSVRDDPLEPRERLGQRPVHVTDGCLIRRHEITSPAGSAPRRNPTSADDSSR